MATQCIPNKLGTFLNARSKMIKPWSLLTVKHVVRPDASRKQLLMERLEALDVIVDSLQENRLVSYIDTARQKIVNCSSDLFG
jgi:hypothetical protein